MPKEGEFNNRLKANRTHVHLWSSLNNVKRSDVLEQIDDDFELFEQWVDEARKEFITKLKQEKDLYWIPDWFEEWFGDSDG